MRWGSLCRRRGRGGAPPVPLYGERVSAGDSQRFWDERSRENALFFVDNELDYDAPDLDDFWRRGELALERMLDLAGVRVHADEDVADIGCGVGRMSRALASRVRRVHAVDISAEMLARARELNADVDNVEWLHGDGRSLSVLGDGSVDGCFSHVVFQHVPDPAITCNYVREMGRVLRPGGWALFQVSSDPSVHRPPRSRSLRGRARELVSRVPHADAAWWGSAVEIGELRRAAQDGGLAIEEIFDAGTQYTTVYGRRRAPA